MTGVEDYRSVEGYVADNREMLVRVLRHSSDSYARACAWALIDVAEDDPELTVLQQEFEALKNQRRGAN
jgi:hypothetical protein